MTITEYLDNLGLGRCEHTIAPLSKPCTCGGHFVVYRYGHTRHMICVTTGEKRIINGMAFPGVTLPGCGTHHEVVSMECGS